MKANRSSFEITAQQISLRPFVISDGPKRGSKRQLTVNGLPAYTYHNNPQGVVLCDNVDGWFAVHPK